MFGYPPGERAGQPVEVLVPDRLRAGHESVRMGYSVAPRPRPMGGPGLDLRGRRRDGSEFSVEISLAPVPGADGPPLVVAAVRDVTEARHRERLAARLAAIVQSSDAAILSTRPDRTVDSWNPAAERLFGWGSAEVIGRDLEVLVPEEERSAFERTYAGLAAGERVALIDTHRTAKDGRLVPVAVTISAMRGEHGEVIGYCEVLRDMTERRRQQQELAAALADREVFAERDRIARGLHDAVISHVFAAGISVESAASLISDPAVRQRLDRAVEELEAAARQIRRHIYATPDGSPERG
jgi:PAS domain S-box-containing protein